jgi:hypothetical protein
MTYDIERRENTSIIHIKWQTEPDSRNSQEQCVREYTKQIQGRKYLFIVYRA